MMLAGKGALLDARLSGCCVSVDAEEVVRWLVGDIEFRGLWGVGVDCAKGWVGVGRGLRGDVLWDGRCWWWG